MAALLAKKAFNLKFGFEDRPKNLFGIPKANFTFSKGKKKYESTGTGAEIRFFHVLSEHFTTVRLKHLGDWTTFHRLRQIAPQDVPVNQLQTTKDWLNYFPEACNIDLEAILVIGKIVLLQTHVSNVIRDLKNRGASSGGVQIPASATTAEETSDLPVHIWSLATLTAAGRTEESIGSDGGILDRNGSERSDNFDENRRQEDGGNVEDTGRNIGTDAIGGFRANRRKDIWNNRSKVVKTGPSESLEE
ncbi:hypothetical protein L596_021218 [Steinernema carpocapsae]|uniref:Uncharacterized protein n=1 Tax=Steinernema carpocapsae TaxID=34508 RepID=A0A4U5MX66_STECR|nr:hypothetical protein L596_021218 [Steinernema carpocapsae]